MARGRCFMSGRHIQRNISQRSGAEPGGDSCCLVRLGGDAYGTGDGRRGWQ